MAAPRWLRLAGRFAACDDEHARLRPAVAQAVRASMRCSVTEPGASSSSTRTSLPGSDRYRLIASASASVSSAMSAPDAKQPGSSSTSAPVSYTHLRAHETRHELVCRL